MRKLINIGLALAFAASSLAFVAVPASAQHYGPRCGRHSHWVAGHHNRMGRWIPGHCQHN